MSNDWVSDIHKMHEHYKAHAADFNGDFLQFRQRFVEEEVREMDEAILSNNPEAVVDALIDACVVAIGTLDLAGVDVQKAWNTVLACNMLKTPGENPSRVGSGGFDLVKPEGWSPPSHEGNTGYIALAVQMILKKIDRTGIDRPSQSSVPSHIKTLDEFKEHALAKTHDYDDEHDPEFAHSTYYPGGINDIMYEISKKVKRLRRILKRMYNGGDRPLTDSLDDSFRDISIYSAIGHTYINKKLEGQTEDRDIFNREIS